MHTNYLHQPGREPALWVWQVWMGSENSGPPHLSPPAISQNNIHQQVVCADGQCDPGDGKETACNVQGYSVREGDVLMSSDWVSLRVKEPVFFWHVQQVIISDEGNVI